MKIVLVDDSASVRGMLKTLLALEEGFEVIGEAVDGAQGVQTTLELMPDVVIMDLHMPVMNGIEATQKITDEAPGVIVVAFTSSDSPETSDAIQEAGAVVNLTKGEVVELIGTLRTLR